MQALKLEAVAGWRWMGAGWRLFRSQPFSLAALLFLYCLLLLCANVVVEWLAEGVALGLPFLGVDALATVGSLLVATLTPALTIGFLQACRVAASGMQVHPVLLFSAFRSGRKTLGRLFVLGAIQMAALVVILLATSGTDAFRAEPRGGAPGERSAAAVATPSATTPAVETPRAAATDAAAVLPSPAEQAAMQRAALQRILQGIAYLPVTLAMWFAPMLVAWHDLPPGKALFFSMVAVWRNRGPFAVYGVAWIAVWMGLVLAVSIVALVAGMSSIAVFLAAPLVMLMLTCMYCSVYPSYATVFIDRDSVPVPSAPRG